MMRKNYCQQCGLMYRLWMHKTEHEVCDECEPEKFKELHNQNIQTIKKRTRGQEHISEHHFFPKKPSASEMNSHWEYRKETR